VSFSGYKVASKIAVKALPAFTSLSSVASHSLHFEPILFSKSSCKYRFILLMHISSFCYILKLKQTQRQRYGNKLETDSFRSEAT
jgi:hypothetical protein